jgi:hypothetical protein
LWPHRDQHTHADRGCAYRHRHSDGDGASPNQYAHGNRAAADSDTDRHANYAAHGGLYTRNQRPCLGGCQRGWGMGG